MANHDPYAMFLNMFADYSVCELSVLRYIAVEFAYKHWVSRFGPIGLARLAYRAPILVKK